jgi:hypothetical protein
MARPQCDTPLVLQKIQNILSFTQTTKGQFTIGRGLSLGPHKSKIPHWSIL